MRTLKTQERKGLDKRKKVEADAMLHPNYFLMGTALPNITAKVASLLMHERQENALTVKERNPEEVCYPPVETMLLHKLLCNTAASQAVCCAGLR